MEKSVSSRGGYDEDFQEMEVQPGLEDYLEGVDASFKRLGQDEERFARLWLLMNNIWAAGLMNAASFRLYNRSYMEEMVVHVEHLCLHLLLPLPLLVV